MDLTAPTDEFKAGLQSHRRPWLALEPLGHDVILGAPSGLAGGLTDVVVRQDLAPQLVLLQQRVQHTGGPHVTPIAGVRTGDTAPSSSPATVRPTDLAATTPAAARVARVVDDVAPARSLLDAAQVDLVGTPASHRPGLVIDTSPSAVGEDPESALTVTPSPPFSGQPEVRPQADRSPIEPTAETTRRWGLGSPLPAPVAPTATTRMPPLLRRRPPGEPVDPAPTPVVLHEQPSTNRIFPGRSDPAKPAPATTSHRTPEATAARTTTPTARPPQEDGEASNPPMPASPASGTAVLGRQTSGVAAPVPSVAADEGSGAPLPPPADPIGHHAPDSPAGSEPSSSLPTAGGPLTDLDTSSEPVPVPAPVPMRAPVPEMLREPTSLTRSRPLVEAPAGAPSPLLVQGDDPAPDGGEAPLVSGFPLPAADAPVPVRRPPSPERSEDQQVHRVAEHAVASSAESGSSEITLRTAPLAVRGLTSGRRPVQRLTSPTLDTPAHASPADHEAGPPVSPPSASQAHGAPGGDTRPSEPVPSAIRGALEPTLGVDLFAVEVKRGTGAAVEARRLGARAFTTGGDVHLPAAHGPLTAEPARSLLVHELSHVAQQRRHGPALPSEGSTAGRALEAEARSLEQMWRMPATQPPHAAAMPARPGHQHLHTALSQATVSPSATPPAPTAPTASDPVRHVQRAEGEAEPVEPSSAAASPPPPGGGGDLDQLADQLFPKIRSHLLAELRDHRERSGTLVDQ